MTPIERLKVMNMGATYAPWKAHNAGIHWNNPEWARGLWVYVGGNIDLRSYIDGLE